MTFFTLSLILAALGLELWSSFSSSSSPYVYVYSIIHTLCVFFSSSNPSYMLLVHKLSSPSEPSFFFVRLSYSIYIYVCVHIYQHNKMMDNSSVHLLCVFFFLCLIPRYLLVLHTDTMQKEDKFKRSLDEEDVLSADTTTRQNSDELVHTSSFSATNPDVI